MGSNQPRLRIFAGPNGSGKSTMKTYLKEKWLGVYVNADEIEKTIKNQQSINFNNFNLTIESACFFDFLSESVLLKNNHLQDVVNHIEFNDNSLYFNGLDVNSYHAAVIADFIRHQLIKKKSDLSFETVMSGKDKINFLKFAREQGYRVYLYFVATEDVDINIDRVKIRVKQGGHDVPINKIKERYVRSLDNLKPAIECCDRAYIFDNSDIESIPIAEFDSPKQCIFWVEDIPSWFDKIYQTMV